MATSKRTLIRQGIRWGVFSLFCWFYLEMGWSLYLSELKLHYLEQSRQDALHLYQQAEEKNQKLKKRLNAQEDPFYVEFLLRKKLKLQRSSEYSPPFLHLEDSESLLHD
jgi:hypothetical protein